MEFILFVAPKPKKRPKVYRWSTVNPSKADEELVKEEFTLLKSRITPELPIFDGQVRIALKFFIAVPKSMPKWKYPYIKKGWIRPVTTPDLDNYIKLILDALNKILFIDDNLVTEIHAVKYYTVERPPRIEIKIDQLPAMKLKSDAELECEDELKFLNTYSEEDFFQIDNY